MTVPAPPGGAPGPAGPAPSTVPPAPEGPQRLDPRQKQVWRLQRAIGAGVAALQVGVVEVILRARDVDLPVPPAGVPAAVLVAGLVLAWIWPHLLYERWRYEIADVALELRHGVLTRTHSAIPYFRVQHVDITRGPLERLLGLSTLVVHTASAATDATIPGISVHAADSLRDVILARTGGGDAV